jgi:hypothetical protein
VSETLGQKLDRVIEDAMERYKTAPELAPFRALYGKNFRIFPGDFGAVMFPQSWGDTSCGFGGMAGQAFTSAYTVILIDENAGLNFVYINFRFAYLVTRPSEYFYECVAKQRFPGVTNKAKVKLLERE